MCLHGLRQRAAGAEAHGAGGRAPRAAARRRGGSSGGCSRRRARCRSCCCGRWGGCGRGGGCCCCGGCGGGEAGGGALRRAVRVDHRHRVKRHGGGAGGTDVEPHLRTHAAVRGAERAPRGATGGRAAQHIAPAAAGSGPIEQAIARPRCDDGHQLHHRHGTGRRGHQQLARGERTACARRLLRKGAGPAIRGAHLAGAAARGEGPARLQPVPLEPRALLPGGWRGHRCLPALNARLQGARPREAPLPAVRHHRRRRAAHAHHSRRGSQTVACLRARGHRR
mmetsp:Transcript_10322/g.25992  ORF Transcript_10322/g.25992 Transcript_10322/m.25992 type:complete len:281 (+) Transcript_10322:1810-2652(+)